MMFNKLLITFDADVRIENYLEAAKTLSDNTDPENDIVFIKGPLDILDHSSTKFAFGSKAGIDATKKFAEELRSDSQISVKTEDLKINGDEVKTKYPEIKEINIELLKKGISVVFISIQKNSEYQVKELSKRLFEEDGFKNVKFLIAVDYPVDVFDIEQVVWIFAGNLEPERDCFVYKAKSENAGSHIAFDGTRKRKDTDRFKRDWPDIVTSDDATIELVNKRWAEYNIGDFIESPSLKYKPLVLSKTAIVE
jgi:4-hydroxy-3-polyprenylbenzoate decarboxylase